jgi:hypothetical protein
MFAIMRKRRWASGSSNGFAAATARWGEGRYALLQQLAAVLFPKLD